MGSYLSIVNNTNDVWHCKLSHDEAALKIAGIVIGVVGAVATVIATAGAAVPLTAALAANGVVAIQGVPMAALATVATGAAAVSGYATAVGSVSGFGLAVARATTTLLNRDGFHTIEPGAKHQWGRMTLSLWQQGTCIRVVNVNERKIRLDTLYMRPIFSGATDGSNNDHDIQWWLNRNGVSSQEMIANGDASSHKPSHVPGQEEIITGKPKQEHVSEKDAGDGHAQAQQQEQILPGHHQQQLQTHQEKPFQQVPDQVDVPGRVRVLRADGTVGRDEGLAALEEMFRSGLALRFFPNGTVSSAD